MPSKTARPRTSSSSPHEDSSPCARLQRIRAPSRSHACVAPGCSPVLTRGRAGAESAVPIAAGIFLDILNVFLLLLNLFGDE